MIGCASDSHESVKHFMEVSVDGIQYQLGPNKPNVSISIGANENCDDLYVVAQQEDYKNGTVLKIEMGFTQRGALKWANLVKHTPEDGSKNFHGTFYDPAKYLRVNNVNYQPADSSLYFEFEGLLLDASGKESVSLNGYMESTEVKTTRCGLNTAGLNSYSFSIFETTSYSNSVSDSYSYHFRSAIGDYVQINIPTSIKDYTIGSYRFTSSQSDENNIEFKNFTGPASIYGYGPDFSWRIFDVEATIELQSRVENVHGTKTIGTISLQAYENGNLVRLMRNAEIIFSD